MHGRDELLTILPQEDLEHILYHTSHLWDEIRGKSIFLSGATGFFGKWLLESLIYVNDKMELGAEITVLTRNKSKFISDYPHLALDPIVTISEGCITDFILPSKEYYAVIHAAIDYKDDSLELYDSCVRGTSHMLDLAVKSGTKKFLFTSSGAVYGRQHSDIQLLTEDFNGSPDPFSNDSAYGLAKKISEYLISEYARKYGFEAKIARCFAFIGPYLPLDKGSAIGNFIRNAIEGENIVIKGDGTPFRSYMYGSDLAIWLWTILLRGKTCLPYNIGSENEVCISDLAAEVVSLVNPTLSIEILGKRTINSKPERYIPCVSRAKKELNLDILVSRSQAISKTAKWYLNNSSKVKHG